MLPMQAEHPSGPTAPNAVEVTNAQLTTDANNSTNFQFNSTMVTNDVRPSDGVTNLGPQPYDSYDIKDFLAKPTRVAAGTISTADAANTQIYTTSIATAMEANSLWYRKLAGYNLIRATAIVKVQINANMFQQGRLLLGFLPCYRHYAAYNNAFDGMHNLNLAQKTQQPCVELDIQDSVMEMKIPYVTPYYYYDRTSTLFDWGSIFLSILSPLRTGAAGETTIGYTVWLSFENVELAAPIFGPESSGGGSSKIASKRTNTKLQSEAKDIQSKGSVTTTLETLSSAAGMLSGVPVIGALAGTASAVTAGLASVASAFGWSKPISTQTTDFLINHPARNLTHSAGIDPSDSLAIAPSAMVNPVSSLTGTNVDEMSFEFLKGIPAYFDTFEWTLANTVSTQIYSRIMTPLNFMTSGVKTVGANNTFYRTGPPAFWLAQFFQNYRGSVNLTFKFVKAPAHIGSIAISYSPDSVSRTLDQGQYLLREVIDLRTTNEITVTIPYLAAQNFMKTGYGGNATPEAFGYVQVHVVNQLRAPETCNNSVQVLVYASAGPDFELAVPVPTSKAIFSAESGVNLPTETAAISKCIGHSSVPAMGVEHNAASVSDPFVSLKQFVNSGRKINSNVAVGAAGTIYPFSLTANTNSGAATLAQANGLTGDYINYFSSGYAFARGGVRLSAVATTNYVAAATPHLNNINPVLATSSVAVSNAFGTSVPLTDTNCPLTVMRSDETGMFDVSMPQQSATPIRLNRYNLPSVSVGTLEVDRPPFSITYQSAATLVLRTLMRSGTDDFSLSYFIGFPPLAYYQGP